jgi:hypothetical protein
MLRVVDHQDCGLAGFRDDCSNHLGCCVASGVPIRVRPRKSGCPGLAC